MNTTLWVVASLLAAVFMVAGFTKQFVPYRKLAEAPGATWVNEFSPGFVKTLGVVETVGAIGLILPGLLDIAPILVPLAAVGLGFIMVGAAAVTFRLGETKHAALNLVYLTLALFVAAGRFGPVAFG